MAKAPVPGRAQQDEAAQVKIRITMGGKTVEIQPAAVTLSEKFVIRQATGLPFEAFFSAGMHAIGEDSLAVLWWLGRRASGEANLPWQQFVAEWVLDADSLEVEEISAEGDDSPEV